MSGVHSTPSGGLACLSNANHSDEYELTRRPVPGPQRLFAAKEYRAAVISAMALLEAKLGEGLNRQHHWVFADLL
jgi:hypothetical protein